MSKLVIETQYMENYDVDDVTEEGHWKFKGGNTFIVEYDNSMSREFVLSWTVESDDWVSQYEKDQKEWSDGSFYHDPRLFKNDFGHWIKIRKFDGYKGGYEYHDNLNTDKVVFKHEYKNKEVAA